MTALPEDAPQTVEEGIAAPIIIRLLNAGRLETPQKLALLVGKADRHHYIHDHLKVSAPPTPQTGHPLTPQSKRRPRLRPRFYPHLRNPLKRRHLDEVDPHPVNEIIPITHELWIFLNLYSHVQISRRRASIPGMSRSRHPDPHPVLDAARYLDLSSYDLRNPAAPPTILALDHDGPSAPCAFRTSLRAHHLPEQTLAHRPHDPHPPAGAACTRLRSPHAVADRASRDTLCVYFTFYSKRRLSECNLYFNLNIASAARSAR